MRGRRSPFSQVPVSHLQDHLVSTPRIYTNLRFWGFGEPCFGQVRGTSPVRQDLDVCRVDLGLGSGFRVWGGSENPQLLCGLLLIKLASNKTRTIIGFTSIVVIIIVIQSAFAPVIYQTFQTSPRPQTLSPKLSTLKPKRGGFRRSCELSALCQHYLAAWGDWTGRYAVHPPHILASGSLGLRA